MMCAADTNQRNYQGSQFVFTHAANKQKLKISSRVNILLLLDATPAKNQIPIIGT
jgi:hypothetical protein